MQNTQPLNTCHSCGSDRGPDARFCPACGTPVRDDGGRPGERPAAAVADGPSTTRKAARVLIPVVAVVGGVLIWNFLNPSVHPVIRKQPVVTNPVAYGPQFVPMVPVKSRVEGDDLVFSLDDVLRYSLVRFEYAGGTTPRAVLAYIGTDGRIVTAISVSEHCGSTEFRIKDNRIYCAHCPSNWDMMTMEAFACCGKYYPDPIPSRVIGNEIHIRKESVEKWAGRL